MYYYKIYGKTISSNVEMPLLNGISEFNTVDIQIMLEYENLYGNDIYINKKCHKEYEIKLGEFALYHINCNLNTIKCYAKNFSAFFSTLFNIPFSVYFLCKKEMLFHACSVLHKREVICLAGNKGVGKSTLMSLLSTTNKFQTFGDDTIFIDKNSIGHRAHNLSKLTKETVSALNVEHLGEQNIAGKFYKKFINNTENAPIKGIIQIVRFNETTPVLVKLNDRMKIRKNLIANIVGVSYMPYDLMAPLLRLESLPGVDFYELKVPDDLRCLRSCKEELVNIITKTMEEDAAISNYS